MSYIPYTYECGVEHILEDGSIESDWYYNFNRFNYETTPIEDMTFRFEVEISPYVYRGMFEDGDGGWAELVRIFKETEPDVFVELTEDQYTEAKFRPSLDDILIQAYESWVNSTIELSEEDTHSLNLPIEGFASVSI